MDVECFLAVQHGFIYLFWVGVGGWGLMTKADIYIYIYIRTWMQNKKLGGHLEVPPLGYVDLSSIVVNICIAH